MHDFSADATNIKVVGVGGAGGNAVAHMIARNLSGVDFICSNTDAQVLLRTGADTLLQLGETGMGAGANPEMGREAAIRDKEKIAQLLKGANMVFVTAGMGGGTGTGAAPVIAEIAKELGILTVGVVTKPFEFEGAKRMRMAEAGILELSANVDSLIVVLNERLSEVLGDDVTQREAFLAADNILYNAVSGISEIINCPGMINVDYQDVCTVMSEKGRAMMGSSESSGPDRARDAAENAIACPLLEGVNLTGARGILVNITASESTLKLKEPRDVMNIIKNYAASDATIIYGAVYDEAMEDRLRVTVVVTGLAEPSAPAPNNPYSPLFNANSRTLNLDVPSVLRKRTEKVISRSTRSGQTTILNSNGDSTLHSDKNIDLPSFLKKKV